LLIDIEYIDIDLEWSDACAMHGANISGAHISRWAYSAICCY